MCSEFYDNAFYLGVLDYFIQLDLKTEALLQHVSREESLLVYMSSVQ